jgi:hypothetical protein
MRSAGIDAMSGAPEIRLVHFVCTTGQSICSNSAILGATDSLSTGVDVSQFVLQLGVGRTPPPVPTYIYTGCFTDWVQTLVTTISCRLGQSNGSLTCPFAGRVTAGACN